MGHFKKELFFQKDNLLVFPLFLLFFSLSFYRVAGSLPLLLLIISFFYSFFIAKKKIQSFYPLSEKLFLLFTFIYFIIGFLSFIPSSNYTETWTKLELRFSIFLIPFLLFYFLNSFSISIKKLLYVSIFGNLISLFYFIFRAAFQFHIVGYESFFYTHLFEGFHINPIHYSALLSMNSISVFYLFSSQTMKSFMVKYALLFLFYIGIVLCSSKAGLLVMTISMLFFLGYELIHHFKKGILLLFISILMFVFLLVSPFKHLAFERMSSTQFYLENNSSTNLNERFPRLIVWENTIEIIKENELFGVGIANTNEVLKTRYEQIGFGKGLKGNFNAHNQFLEVLLASGWIGLASLWSIFMFLIYKAIIYKSHYMLHFLAIIIFYMSIESYFESQMGLFAFVLIASVLLHKCTIHVQ